jgi:hypothetical protein
VETELLYLRRAGGISIAAWEQAVLSNPETQIVYQKESLEDVGGIEFKVSYAGPGAQVRLKYAPGVWVRSGETHFWHWAFFYSNGAEGQVYFERLVDHPVREAARRFSELLGAKIVNESGVEQAV